MKLLFVILLAIMLAACGRAGDEHEYTPAAALGLQINYCPKFHEIEFSGRIPFAGLDGRDIIGIARRDRHGFDKHIEFIPADSPTPRVAIQYGGMRDRVYRMGILPNSAEDFDLTDENALALARLLRDAFEQAFADFPPELCDCGENFAREVARRPTPPLNMRESPTPDFLEEFDNVHNKIFHEFDIFDWQGLPADAVRPPNLAIWADVPLRDFSFITLNHNWFLSEVLFYTRDVIFTIDELAPGDVVALDVVFAHYLIPRGGLTFIDEDGERHWMLISESMRGGCFGIFHISFFDNLHDAPPDNFFGIEPDYAQRAALTAVIGDFDMGEIQMGDFGEYAPSPFRKIYPRQNIRYADLDFAPLTPHPPQMVNWLNLDTAPGDILLIHSEKFNKS
ncbi:MAG: hypothetical protein FWB71_02100 [Defluviitaleaceae bacterium]|nr:hypothetical protein [Defluviitaleaceae bacterium]